MSTRHLLNKRKNKSKKGISPVVATVILVAVAVVIAAALAGFAGSLFGSYSQASQVKLQSLTLSYNTGDASMSLLLSNAGGSADKVVRLSSPGINGVALADVTVDATNAAPDNSVGANTANTAMTITGTGWDLLDSDGVTPAIGQQMTVQIHMQSGQVITQTVNIQA